MVARLVELDGLRHARGPAAGGAARVESAQTLVQLSDELLARLDARVAREGRSRSELIRAAVADYLVDDREAEIDQRILEAYTLYPQEDLLGTEATAAAMVAAEPWKPAGD